MKSRGRPARVVAEGTSAFAQAVREGLLREGQKELPCRYLYDDVGSALFEVITRLPEYGLTRADERLLLRHAGEVARRFTSPPLVVELGSGSGRKTRHLLQALGQPGLLEYRPIDVSPEALRACASELAPFARVTPIEAEYLEGLERAMGSRRGRRVLLLFLGGTIGNFDSEARGELFAGLSALLAPGDHLLFGADLMQDPGRLIPAYADPLGVTAAFNLNILARINRELGGDFDLSQFEHLARFDKVHQRMEMHLRSRRPQRVTIRDAAMVMDLAEGETIWTEASYKFEGRDLDDWSHRFGFRSLARWVDDEWPFAEVLWERGFRIDTPASRTGSGR